MVKKVISIVVILVMALAMLTACTDSDMQKRMAELEANAQKQADKIKELEDKNQDILNDMQRLREKNEEMSNKNSELKDMLEIDNLNKTIENIIANDYQEQFGNKFYYDDYYGTYSGCYVFFIECDAMYAKKVIVSGMVFRWNIDWNILIWKDGQFCFIETACEQNFLTQKDIKKIAYHHAERAKKSFLANGDHTEEEFNNWYYNTED